MTIRELAQASPTAFATPKQLLEVALSALDPPVEPSTPIEASELRRGARASAAAELDRLGEAEAADMPALRNAEAKARQHLERLTPAYQVAQRGQQAAAAALTRRAHDLGYARTLATRAIEAAAEPIIDEFARRLLDLHAATLSIRIEEQQQLDGYDRAHNKLFATFSNAPSIASCAAAILEAYRKALSMKVDADQENIRTRLAALLDDLPDSYFMTKVYAPPAYEPPTKWPSYEEARAEPKRLPFVDGFRSGLVRLLGRQASA